MISVHQDDSRPRTEVFVVDIDGCGVVFGDGDVRHVPRLPNRTARPGTLVQLRRTFSRNRRDGLGPERLFGGRVLIQPRTDRGVRGEGRGVELCLQQRVEAFAPGALGRVPAKTAGSPRVDIP